jgi:hypothetical protein
VFCTLSTTFPRGHHLPFQFQKFFPDQMADPAHYHQRNFPATQVTLFSFAVEDYEFSLLNVYGHFIGPKPRKPLFKLNID